MTAFQWIGIPIVGVLLLGTLGAASKRRISPAVAFLWSVVWIAAAVAIARPSLTAVVAKILGIGRGADLILYCSVVGMLIGFFMMYVRYRKVQEEITTIVRHIALQEASGKRASLPAAEESSTDR